MEFPSPTYEFTLWVIFTPSFARKLCSVTSAYFHFGKKTKTAETGDLHW